MMGLMDTDNSTTGPMNIGNPGEFTMTELATKIIQLTGSNSKVVKGPLPQDDPMHRRPDITMAKAVLGWEPRIQLAEGLQKTIDYFKSIDN